MLLAVVEDRFGLFLVHKIKGEMGGHVTDSKRQQQFRFKTVVHPLGIGVDDIIRQCRFRDPSRLTTRQLPPRNLRQTNGARWNRLASVISDARTSQSLGL